MPAPIPENRTRRSRKARARLGAVLLALSVLSSCAPPPEPEVAPTVPGYLALRETFGPRDFGPLQGRRIVIDPGHGGYFRGALGPDGLTEAEVNLGVALHLRGLLEWAGADVDLTRTADYDFLTPADSTLASDLASRVAFTDSIQPDVFLSVHHNSTAARDETINETQTYYPLHDNGPSLELARAIHRHLVRNLEIRPAKILPGNFHVLRNATVPAVLGEPAMISHPVMEHRLSLASSQKLEAEAYFLGLLDYFQAGTPRWIGPEIVLPADDGAPRIVHWRFLAEGDSTNVRPPHPAPGPDPSSFRLLANGAPAPLHTSPDGVTVTFLEKTSSTDIVKLSLNGMNLAGRAAPTAHTVLPPAPASRLIVDLLRPSDPLAPALGHWHSVGGPLPGPGRLQLEGFDDTDLLEGASGTAILTPSATRREISRFEPDQGRSIPVSVKVIDLPVGRDWRLLRAGSALDSSWFANHPWRMRSGSARPTLPGAPAALTCNPSDPIWLTIPGLLPAVRTTDMAGFEQGTTGDGRIWTLPPLLPATAGRTIVIDPAGGEGSPGPTGATGLRAADVNLAVAQEAARLLRGAGAQVILTREDGHLLPDPDKVRLAEKYGADLFLVLERARAGDPLRARHHPGSVAGSAWAEALTQAWQPLAAVSDTLAVARSWAYLLRHTACPALEVFLPGPDRNGWEEILENTDWLRAEARALLLATCAVFDSDRVLNTAIDPLVVLHEIAPLMEPDAIQWIEWDGNFLWTLPAVLPAVASSSRIPAESVSSIAGPGLPARGPVHTLEVHTRDRWQLWLVERHDGRWSGRILLEGESTR